MENPGDGGHRKRKQQLPSYRREPQPSEATQQEGDHRWNPPPRGVATSDDRVSPQQQQQGNTATAAPVPSAGNTSLPNHNPLVVSLFGAAAPAAGSGSARLPTPQQPAPHGITGLEAMRQLLGNPTSLQQQPVADSSQMNLLNLSQSALLYQEQQQIQQRLIADAARQSVNDHSMAASNPTLSLAASNRNATVPPQSLNPFNAEFNANATIPPPRIPPIPATAVALPLSIPPPNRQQQLFMNSFAALDSLRQACPTTAGAANSRLPASGLAQPFPIDIATNPKLSATARQILSQPNLLQAPSYQGTPRTANLYMEISDNSTLSDHQILLRQQIEFFEATSQDVRFFCPSRRGEISIGQVGIRCKHCAAVLQPHERKKGCVYFPASLRALYQAAQNMGTTHFLGNCDYVSPQVQQRLQAYVDAPARAGYGGKNYWAQSARNRGIYETELGLRFRCHVI